MRTHALEGVYQGEEVGAEVAAHIRWCSNALEVVGGAHAEDAGRGGNIGHAVGVELDWHRSGLLGM